MSSCHLAQQCVGLVQSGSVADVAEVLRLPCNEDVVANECWSLLKEVVTAFMTDTARHDDAESLEALKETLLTLAERGNAKEMVFALLEQVEAFTDDWLFVATLPALSVTIERLEKKQLCLDIVLETLYSHVATMEVPEEYKLCESDDGHTLTCEGIDSLGPLLNVVGGLVDFVSALCSSLKNGCADLGRVGCDMPAFEFRGRSELSDLLMKLLDCPLSRLRCSSSGEGGSVALPEECCRRIVRLLAVLQPDFSRYWQELAARATSASKCPAPIVESAEDIKDVKRMQTVEQVSQKAVGHFIFLVMVRHMCLDNFPSIYHDCYVFDMCLKSLCTLFESADTVEMEKGLLLLTELLSRVPCKGLSESFLEHEGFRELVKIITHYATTSSVLYFRRQFARLIPIVLKKFSSKGRFALLVQLFGVTADVSVKSYLVYLVKEQVHEYWDSDDAYFDSKQLNKLLDIVFTLPNGATTDLVEHGDFVTAAINVVIYMLLRDKNKQKLAWKRVEALKESFLLPLETCLTMSKLQYGKELEKLFTGRGQPVKLPKYLSVTVGNEKVAPNMTAEAQIEFLKTSLRQFGLLESALRRALELAG